MSLVRRVESTEMLKGAGSGLGGLEGGRKYVESSVLWGSSKRWRMLASLALWQRKVPSLGSLGKQSNRQSYSLSHTFRWHFGRKKA